MALTSALKEKGDQRACGRLGNITPRHLPGAKPARMKIYT
jgi:hypothetical protein